MKRPFVKYVDYAAKQGTRFIKEAVAGTIWWKQVSIKDLENTEILKTSITKKNIYDNRNCSSNIENVFYLKVNRDDETALACIQNWLDVIGEFSSPTIIFVCDRAYLKYIILEKCRFPKNGSISFLNSHTRNVVKVRSNLYTDGIKWKNAACAHIFPFYHARQHGILHHWDIDADDTMFLLSPQKTREAMQQVEHIAEQNKIAAFSLDMWRSRTKGLYWTFGVVYINDYVDFYKLFLHTDNLDWIKPYCEKRLESTYNIDWFFTHLKDTSAAKIEAFYIENCAFVHWGGDILSRPIYGSLYIWHDGVLTFPIISEIYHDTDLGIVPITDTIKIDISLSREEYSCFLQQHFGKLSEYEKNRYGLKNHI